METRKHPNTMLRHEREKRGWSQRRVAEQLDTSEDMISRWERGERKPSRFYQEKLCALFGKDALALGFISSTYSIPLTRQREMSETVQSAQLEIMFSGNSPTVDERGMFTEETESDEDMNRRTALQNIGTLSTVLMTAPQEVLHPDILERLAQTQSRSAFIDTETLHHLQQLIATCWQLSKGHGLEMAGQILAAVHPTLVQQAHQPSPNQPLAAAIAAQGSLLAASLASHKGHLHERQLHSQQAFTFAQTAQDMNLQVAALKQLALTYDYQERYSKVFQVYQQALPHLHQVSPLLRSRMYAGLAGVLAQRQHIQEARRFLGLAYESFPETVEEDPSILYADSGYFTLLLWDGLAHLELGKPKDAWNAFVQVDGLRPNVTVPERVRIEFLNYQAEALIGLREMESGCHYLEEAVKSSLALGSERRYSESWDVYKKMSTIWRDEKRVQALQALFVC